MSFNNMPDWLVKTYFFLFYYYQYIHEFFIPLFKNKSDYKIFCVGYWKTGTNSIWKALTILGYRSGKLIRLAKEPKQGWVEYVKKSNYDAFTDDPMIFIYKELDKALPNSKFILTVRDEQSFTKSYINYFKDTPVEKSPKEVDELLNIYKKHNQEVKNYFKDKQNKLLIINVTAGEGWEKLCPFLNKPIPNKPFPHKNKGRYKK